MERPESVAAVAALVTARPRLQVRGAGTKPALSSPRVGATTIDLTGLDGLVEYTPEECTFTALAGTPLRAIEAALTRHGHHLPFDPPLVEAGATIGGTVAAGLNGSCRYRFGGIRDFLIGVQVVDGRGRVLRSGGKVVKNAAGFLLHQALVGSCGRYGILTEVTFKVFPAAPAHVTVRVALPTLTAALEMLTAVQRARLDLEALDLVPPATLYLRLGGFSEALPARIAAATGAIAVASEVVDGDEDARIWREAREFAWAADAPTLVRVPLTPAAVPRLDDALAAIGAARRYTVGANLALLASPTPVAPVAALLAPLGLIGQVLRGDTTPPFIGACGSNVVDARVRDVMDPDGRFAPPALDSTE